MQSNIQFSINKCQCHKASSVLGIFEKAPKVDKISLTKLYVWVLLALVYIRHGLAVSVRIAHICVCRCCWTWYTQCSYLYALPSTWMVAHFYVKAVIFLLFFSQKTTHGRSWKVPTCLFRTSSRPNTYHSSDMLIVQC